MKTYIKISDEIKKLKGCKKFYYHVTYMFQSKSTLYNCVNGKECLARNRCNIWSLSDSNGIQTHSHLTVCSCHVTYAFQSEFTLYSCLNVKELLTQSRCGIWSLSDCCCTRTQNHLVCKQALNYLAKLAKWLSCVVSTYLYI